MEVILTTYDTWDDPPSMDEPSGHGPLGGPDYVTALKSVKASWSEAIALLAGPSATSVAVSADWAKAAEVHRGEIPTGCEGGV